tara:strand:+ start:1317 stop:1685 length:369 start_codon:yes stop_codon:yes gene_type:complete
MEVSFDTEYGLKWFRAEASALSYEKRRLLYIKISRWEHMAKYGPQGWAHAQTEAARELRRRPLTGHMRELLIEIKGLSWVERTELDHFRKKQKEERDRLERRQQVEAYTAKLDSALDELLKE